MIHYHIYIESGATLDETSRFYKVAVGSSKQAQRDYLFLVAHSVDNGHYFEPVSPKTDEFLEKCWSLAQLDRFAVLQVTARELVRSFKTGTSLSLSARALRNADYMRYALDTCYRIQTNLHREASTSAKR